MKKWVCFISLMLFFVANTSATENNFFGEREVVAAKGGSQLSTRFVSTSKGLADLNPTLNRIASGGKFPHRNDGSIFKNFLPLKGLLLVEGV